MRQISTNHHCNCCCCCCKAASSKPNCNSSCIPPKPNCNSSCIPKPSIPVLLVVWFLFDVLCCKFICEDIGQCLSALLLLVIVVKISFHIYKIMSCICNAIRCIGRLLLNFTTYLDDLCDFKSEAEPKLDCTYLSVSAQPNRSHGDMPPIYVEYGKFPSAPSNSKARWKLDMSAIMDHE